MLKITIPFTNEIVFNSENYTDHQVDEVMVNKFDEVRDTLSLSVKSLQASELAVYIITLKCPGSVLISTRVNKYAWIMSFTLGGQLQIHGASNKNIILTEKTHHSLLPATNEQLDTVITGDVNLFVVCLAGSAVKKLLTPEEELILQKRIGKKQGWLPGRLTTPAMNDIIAAVIKCSDNNCLHRIFLAAKMLELLFLDLEQLNNRTDQTIPAAVRLSDLKKLEQAKTLISKNIQAPCSLIELAHKVGLNDFKLKKGFKEAFGTTVFGYLFDVRMEKAKNMLSSSNYTVSEVAHEVGYKNAHHFTAAFKKKYGYLPSKLNK